MAAIDTPVLIVGVGPAALVAAKVLSGRGVPCLVAGHEVVPDVLPVELDDDAVATLAPHGVLDVLRPYAASQEPFIIAPLDFEQALKHHCIADMIVTVFDGLSFQPAEVDADTAACVGVLTDGRSRWDLRADALLDAAELPSGLNEAVRAAAERADAIARLPAVVRR